MYNLGFELHGLLFFYLKPFVVVEEQKDPDPEFPTVKFPNPEEGKSALDLSIKTAEANGSTIILANDPDADRLACAVKTNKCVNNDRIIKLFHSLSSANNNWVDFQNFFLIFIVVILIVHEKIRARFEKLEIIWILRFLY